jgi:hypothetical protein
LAAATELTPLRGFFGVPCSGSSRNPGAYLFPPIGEPFAVHNDGACGGPKQIASQARDDI